MKSNSIKRDIAVIGISCKFSNSDTPEAFWNNLMQGNDLLRLYTDEALAKLKVPEHLIKDPNYIKLKTKLENSDSFDFPFFGYTSDEANIMDPQIRGLHEQVYTAIDDAGYAASISEEKVGLYLTASENFNWLAHGLINHNKNVDPFFKSHIINKNYVSTLISYNLNLKGPSYVIDTACSSSLTTVHVACRNLLMRECSLAIAGGLNYRTEKNSSYQHKEGMIGSADGYCRAFDEDSTGTVPGEGGGVLVLKRLEEALKDNDAIYAVIKASASNNDGKRKVGYTAPSIEGQYECIKQAHRFANIEPRSISYVEAHGTGTKLGDPIEIEALNKAFLYNTESKCAIGSVKSNIGHLDYAAGIAGAIKTILALNYRKLPPSLHYVKPNPKIDFDGGPFYVNDALTNWDEISDKPLRAGVNSLGIGGTNVHLLLEEAPKKSQSGESREHQIIPLSAKTYTSLQKYAQKLLSFTETSTDGLADLSHSLKTTKEDFLYRDSIACATIEELQHGLKNMIKTAAKKSLTGNKKNIVFLFPGQGSQYFTMAADLYRDEPLFTAFMDEGFKLANKITGLNFTEILGYNQQNNPDPNKLNDTLFTQPALFLIEYSLCKMLNAWGVVPDYVIGHSLGEYVAACVSGVFTLEDGLELIVRRARLMDSLKSGSMLSIGISAEQANPLLPELVSIAAINTASSCIVSGRYEAINTLKEVLIDKDIPYTELKTSHAFHSEMMDPILNTFKIEVEKVKRSKPTVPVISNRTGTILSEKDAQSASYWSEHMRGTVNFKKGIDYIMNQGDALFIEVGPGKSLSSFIKQHEHYQVDIPPVTLLRHPKAQINDSEKLAEAVGQIWQYGGNINWKDYDKGLRKNRIHVPTYAFDTYSLDYAVEPFKQLENSSRFKAQTQSLEGWFYLQNWKKSLLIKGNEQQIPSKNCLFFTNDDSFSTALIKKIRESDTRVITIGKSDGFKEIENDAYLVDSEDATSISNIFDRLNENNIYIDQVVLAWEFYGESQEQIVAIFSFLQSLCKNLVGHFPKQQKRLVLIANLGQSVVGSEQLNLGYISALQLIHICAQENPEISFQTIDIDTSEEKDQLLLLQQVSSDIQYKSVYRNIAYRNNIRWSLFYENISCSHSETNHILNKEKVVLITGGLGEVGRVFAKHLGEEYGCKLILLGRSTLPEEDKWDTLLKKPTANTSEITKIKALVALKHAGIRASYYSTDISNFNNFSETVERIEQDHGFITGIIHAAGNINPTTFKTIENLDKSIAKQQFNPKIAGTINLYRLFCDAPLDFVWITSSLSSVLGGLTYGAYSVANKFIDEFVSANRKTHPNWYSIALDGITKSRISHEKLIEIFERTISSEVFSHLVVSVKEPNQMLEKQRMAKAEDTIITRTAEVDRPYLKNSAYVAPNSKSEIAIGELWKSLFGYKEIGIHDNFFDLGGDSLKAMTLLKRVHATLNVEVSIEDFFSNPTVGSLAEAVDLSNRVVDLQKKVKGAKILKI